MSSARTSSPSGGPLRVMIYSRVSTDDQAEAGISIQEQPGLVKEHLDRTFGPGRWLLVDEVKDEGLSGSYGPTIFDHVDSVAGAPRRGRKWRPSLERVFRAIKNDEIDAVAVYTLSRLYREPLAQLNFIDQMLKPRGMLLISAKESVDIYSASGRFQANILAAAAGFQRESSNDNVKDIIRRRKESGLWHGQCPYGWRFPTLSEQEAGYPKTIKAIPEQLDHVKLVAKLYLEGHSEQSIARRLNDEGVPFFMKKTVNGSRQTSWDFQKVRILLRNPAHAGMVQLGNGELIRGYHYEQRAFDLETYQAIQSAGRDRRRRYRGVRSERPEMLLSGIAMCASCGGKLMVRYTDNQRSYTCRGLRNEALSRHVRVDADTLEKAVLHEVEKLATSPELLRQAAQRIGEQAGHEARESKAKLEKLRERKTALDQQRSNAVRQLREDVLSAEDYKELRKQIEAEETYVVDQIGSLEQALAGSYDSERLEKRALAALKDFPLLWSNLKPCERAELMRSAIEELVIGDEHACALMKLKLHLMPVVCLRLPRLVASREREKASGIEAITLSELAALWHLLEGKRPTEGALAMGISKSTFSSFTSRAAQRLGEDSPLIAARKARTLIKQVEHLLPLNHVKRKRRHKRNDLTAFERVVLDRSRVGGSHQEIADALGAPIAKVATGLVSAQAKLLKENM